MVRYFGKSFQELPRTFREELRNLQEQGCIYSQFWRDDKEKFAFCRIQFRPKEIVQYVESLHSYDVYLRALETEINKEEALKEVPNKEVRDRVREYNRDAESRGAAKYSPASFYTDHLELLVCGMLDDRYEFLQDEYTGDRQFLLTEIIEGFRRSADILTDRKGGRPDFQIEEESDVQDLLFAILKPIFPDARPEEYTPKHGGGSKRIDFVISEISTVIEVKYVRNNRHAKEVGDELKVDIESYFKHTDCTRMAALVWDEDRYIEDKSNFEKDLTGPRQIEGTEFNIETYVVR